jgi:hypothetical protein
MGVSRKHSGFNNRRHEKKNYKIDWLISNNKVIEANWRIILLIYGDEEDEISKNVIITYD